MYQSNIKQRFTYLWNNTIIYKKPCFSKIKTMRSAPWCYREKSTFFDLDRFFSSWYYWSYMRQQTFFFFFNFLEGYNCSVSDLGLHIKWPCGGSCFIVLNHLATTGWYICTSPLVVSLRLRNYGPSICAIIYWTAFEEIHLLFFHWWEFLANSTLNKWKMLSYLPMWTGSIIV